MLVHNTICIFLVHVVAGFLDSISVMYPVLSNNYFSQAQKDYPSGILTSILFMPFGFIAPKTLNYLAFQSFDLERT
jgi:hypothetical protein